MSNDKIDRTAVALKTLEEGIMRLTSSDEWARYLQFQAAFHSYSFSNVQLIMAQRPDATRVAGFRTWEKLGRHVRKGETALWIFAPRIFKPKSKDAAAVEGDSQDDESDERRIVTFKAVPVFALEQTEGDELPSPVKKLTGDTGAEIFTHLKVFSEGRGCPVSVEDFDGQANGFFRPDENTITVRAGLFPDQAAKTLAHEIAHSILHRDIEVYRSHRGDCELEAESTAFVVLSHFGLNSGDYSFGYAASWQGGGSEAIRALKSCAGRIQATAKMIIEAIDLDVDAAPVAAVS